MTDNDNANPTINMFQIWVVQECEDGSSAQPGTMAMRTTVQDGKLIPIMDAPLGDDACDPIAKVIRRKLAPRSGNHLFVTQSTSTKETN